MKKIVTRAEAIRQAIPIYYTGKPCRHGHVAERNTVNCVCRVCANNNVKASRERVAAIMKAGKEART